MSCERALDRFLAGCILGQRDELLGVVALLERPTT
jgi:hypothetical protein